MDATPILNSLLDPDSGPRRALVDMLVNQLLDAPLERYVELETLPELIEKALSSENAKRAIERHVWPGFERVRQGLEAADETVGDALPESAKAEIKAMASNPRGPRLGWLRGAVAPEALGALVGPVVQEVLLQFAQNLPLTGKAAHGGGASSAHGTAGSGARGLVGRLSRSTGKLMEVGKSVADGLGVDVEGRIKDAARDFSQGATGVVQRAVRERLREPEGQAAVERIAGQVTSHIMGTALKPILDDADRLPLKRAFDLAPSVIAHNVGREPVRALIAGELNAYFGLMGSVPARQVLQEYGLLEEVQGWATRLVDAEARQLFGSDPFANWLSTLLAAGD